MKKKDKVKPKQIVDNILFVICLCVIAIRSTYNETLEQMTLNSNQFLSNPGFSVVLSSVLILSAISYFFLSCFRSEFRFRFSGIEVGYVVFVLFGIVSVFFASNKRIAITDLVTLAAPITMAVLLVQILDRYKIKLLLMVLICLGLLSTIQCINQYREDNQQLIDDYEKNPGAQLSVLGIEPDSLSHMLYEHRLYSKDIRGYLTTSNSVGSFLLLTGFSALAMCIYHFHSRQTKQGRLCFFCYLVVFIILIGGLLLTQSKGAIGACVLASLALGLYFLNPALIKRLRVPIVILGILGMVVLTIFIGGYLAGHDALPGGNSILVRSQYWQSSMKLFKDHPFGVGGGNFSYWYPRYKDPAAPETVKDPHNIVFALLTEYGVHGFLAFVCCIAWPLGRILFHSVNRDKNPPSQFSDNSLRLPGAIIICVTLVLLVVRPYLLAMETTDNSLVIFYITMTIFILPVSVFIIAFWLIWKMDKIAAGSDAFLFSPHVQAALVLGLAAVLIHNLADFAFFEPVVMTVFWALLAVIITMNKHLPAFNTVSLPMTRGLRWLFIAGCACDVILLLYFAVIPQVKTGFKIQSAFRNINRAHALLNEAIEDDPLDSYALTLKAKLYRQQYEVTMPDSQELLDKAIECYIQAAERNPVDFKNYSGLAEIYKETKQAGLSYQYYQRALQCYPASDILNFEAAKLADELNKDSEALSYYKKTVEIEESYREQFKEMYPGSVLFSRLGKENYQYARYRFAQLSNQPYEPAD